MAKKRLKRHFVIFCLIFSLDIPENSLEGELLLYLISHRKFYVWQNSSSGIIAENLSANQMPIRLHDS